MNCLIYAQSKYRKKIICGNIFLKVKWSRMIFSILNKGKVRILWQQVPSALL